VLRTSLFVRAIADVCQPRWVMDERTSRAKTTAYVLKEVIRCVKKTVALCLRVSAGETEKEEIMRWPGPNLITCDPNQAKKKSK